MRTIRRYMVKLAKEHIALRGMIRWAMNTYRLIRYHFETDFIKTDDKTIIFSCFGGKSYSCSPKAIYEYMAASDEYKDYTFVWGLKKPNEYNYLLQKYPNTIILKQGSKAYRKYLAKSKYWIFNYKVDDYLKPRKNQVFVQCWHGTPLKKLGCDLEHFDNVLNTISGIQKRYRIEAEKFDYFLSPSTYASDRFISAWNLKAIGKDDIILQEGYPRNDAISNFTAYDVDRVKRQIFGDDYKENESLRNKKIALYAPTYRSNQHTTGQGYTISLPVDFDYLQRELGDEYIILFRPHYFITNMFDFEKYEGFIYNAAVFDDINELYIITDILITDYSSVFFDYSILKRPMIFYMYDLEYYRDESNGFYIDVEEELPGKIVKSDNELVDEIRRVSNSFVYDEKYKAFNEKYNPLEDGHATERVVKKILN